MRGAGADVLLANLSRLLRATTPCATNGLVIETGDMAQTWCENVRTTRSPQKSRNLVLFLLKKWGFEKAMAHGHSGLKEILVLIGQRARARTKNSRIPLYYSCVKIGHILEFLPLLRVCFPPR